MKVIEECKKIDKEYEAFLEIVKIEGSSDGALSGIYFSFKDNICIKGVRTTAGSRILENYNPVFDATVVERIKREGGTIIGKTCMDEFGFGTFGTNCAFKQPKNPIDKTRVPGGSSSGGGVLTRLAHFPHVAVVESTGGSISAPAAFCGVYGLTPTYGRVSRHGLISYSNSMDKIGLMSKDLKLMKKTWDIIKGKDQKDSTSVEGIEKELGVKKIGVISDYMTASDESIRNEVEEHISRLGVKHELIDLKLVHEALSAYYILAVCEASTNLAKYCGLRYGAQGRFGDKTFEDYVTSIRSGNFGKEAKRRIILGSFARTKGHRAEYYLQAAKVRTLIIREFKELFKKYDMLIAPTMPSEPPTLVDAKKMLPAKVYANDLLTCAPNLCGFPMLSKPIGKRFTGLHMICDHFGENKLFEVAKWRG